MGRFMMTLWGLLIMVTFFSTPVQAAEPGEGVTAEVEQLLLQNFEYTCEYTGACPQASLPTSLWGWYWHNKAQIDPAWLPCFWGEDDISDAFSSASEKIVLPVWNYLMKFDVVRIALLVISVGALLGTGAKIVL